jgi:hypothetical protein
LARARFPSNVPRAKVPLEWPPPEAETEPEGAGQTPPYTDGDLAR